MTSRMSDHEVLAAYAGEVRRLGRVPTSPELRLARRNDPDFPSHNVFARFGSKAALLERVASFCVDHDGYADVLALMPPVPLVPPTESATDEAPASMGFVYLLRSGRYFKIGLTINMEERVGRLKIQLPDPVVEVHRITTDDPRGIERYWHDRFQDRRKNGEWFELSSADVAAFRRRRFM